jgi:hypothetical protein
MARDSQLGVCCDLAFGVNAKSIRKITQLRFCIIIIVITDKFRPGRITAHGVYRRPYVFDAFYTEEPTKKTITGLTPKTKAASFAATSARRQMLFGAPVPVIRNLDSAVINKLRRKRLARQHGI